MCCRFSNLDVADFYLCIQVMYCTISNPYPLFLLSRVAAAMPSGIATLLERFDAHLQERFDTLVMVQLVQAKLSSIHLRTRSSTHHEYLDQCKLTGQLQGQHGMCANKTVARRSARRLLRFKDVLRR